MPSSDDLPLAGMRVIDFANGFAGPLASMVLGDLGAEVIKIEAIDGGDLTRDLTPPMFLAANRNKRSVAINVKHERGREVAERLIRSSDVVVESFRPGIMDSLGLGSAAMIAAHPTLIYASFSGFGSSGPHAKRRAVDAVAQAETGMIVANENQEAPFTIVDTTAGIVLAQAVLAALLKRARTGRGERVEAALLPTALYLQSVQLVDFSLNGTVLTPTERARRAPTASIFRAFDGLIYVAAHYEEHWRILCEVLGSPDLPHDPRFETRALRVEHGEELKAVLGDLFSRNTRRHWFELLNARGVMAAVVRSYDEVVHETDETTASWFFDAMTPAGESVKLVANPYRFGGETFPLRSSPPRLGAHSAAVLRDLGYDDDEIRSLFDATVIAGDPTTTATEDENEIPTATRGGNGG